MLYFLVEQVLTETKTIHAAISAARKKFEFHDGFLSHLQMEFDGDSLIQANPTSR